MLTTVTAPSAELRTASLSVVRCRDSFPPRQREDLAHLILVRCFGLPSLSHLLSAPSHQ